MNPSREESGPQFPSLRILCAKKEANENITDKSTEFGKYLKGSNKEIFSSYMRYSTIALLTAFSSWFTTSTCYAPGMILTKASCTTSKLSGIWEPAVHATKLLYLGSRTSTRSPGAGGFTKRTLARGARETRHDIPSSKAPWEEGLSSRLRNCCTNANFDTQYMLSDVHAPYQHIDDDELRNLGVDVSDIIM